MVFAIPGDLEAPTGGTGYDRRLIAEWRRAGIRVRHLALGAAFPHPAAADAADAARQLAGLGDGTVVLIDGLAFGALPDLARREAGRLRLVALVHHPLALETGLEPETARRLAAAERAALEAAVAVVTTSPDTGRRLVADYGVAPDRLTVAVPGTDPAEFAAASGDPPRLLSLGSLIPRKGHDVLIDALAAVADLPWTCRCVGDDRRDPDWVAGLRRRVAEHGLEARITFGGAAADVGPAFAAADLFVLASWYEGYGMAFCEAVAHGLPVVGCAGGAVAEAVPAGAGRLVAPGDAAAFAAALRPLLADADVRRAARDATRAAAADLPRWPETAAIVADVLAAAGSFPALLARAGADR
ncbi:glycosyltransferase family 4 protein [Methylobrevis sp. L22]|uniref:Glycosyltransferase family 4 protein n=1 Tax=Methylobrevis albus TaxID=2793297 RepID=A0A931I2X2_9HYPH|nr:glycosyltransferase family 4 protein [Methylobrevis albus]